MPKSTREWAKRQFDSIEKNANWTGFHIKQVADTYREQHPEIANPLYQSLELLENLTTLWNMTRLKL